MIINLSPQRRDDTLVVVKTGMILNVNGEDFDFSRMGDGDTLPYGAVSSIWFVDKVEVVDGELVVVLLFPNPYNYSQEQAFPKPLIDVPDGVVKFPLPLSEAETLAKFPPSEPEQALFVTNTNTGEKWTTGPLTKIENGDSEFIE